MNLDDLYEKMKDCNSCKLRASCTQVVPAIGCQDNPVLLIVGEAPGAEEDIEGVPFVSRDGQLLREVIRETGRLNKNNTLITNTVKCRPPANKFPTDESADICVEKWLEKEISIAKPKRMLLLGAKALWHVAGMKGVTANRGAWYNVRGIRTMCTFHPSYVMRCESEGKMHIREAFEDDISEVADDIASLG